MWAAGGRSQSFAQELVNEGDSDRPLADCGSDALHVSGADIPDGEDAGQAGLEQVGRAGGGPFLLREVVGKKVGARANEAGGIERDASVQPRGVRDGAGHEEEVPDLAPFLNTSLLVAPDDALEMFFAFERDDFGVGS